MPSSTAFTLAVVEPYMNGIGGRGSLLAHFAAQQTSVVDYTLRARGTYPHLYPLERAALVVITPGSKTMPICSAIKQLACLARLLVCAWH